MLVLMRSTQQFSITLPIEMAETIKAKVASGEYASESEVIRDGMRMLMARDRAVDHWLRTEVVNTFDEVQNDPSRLRSISQVRESLAEMHRKALASKKP